MSGSCLIPGVLLLYTEWSYIITVHSTNLYYQYVLSNCFVEICTYLSVTAIYAAAGKWGEIRSNQICKQMQKNQLLNSTEIVP